MNADKKTTILGCKDGEIIQGEADWRLRYPRLSAAK
jgi:hypothetical protein